MLWDQGEWEAVGDARKGIAQGKLNFVIHGKGRLALIDPYPGYVKLEGWRGQKLLVASDVPLDLNREKKCPVS